MGNAWGGSWGASWGGSWGEDSAPSGGGVNCEFLLNDGTSHILLNDGSSTLLMNDDSCQPPQEVEVTIPPGGGNYLAWWERELDNLLRGRRKKKKKLAKKKQELVDELEEQVDELALIAAEEQVTQNYARELRRQVLESAALLNQAYQAKVSDERLRAEIVSLRAHIQEMDDEETILLALH